MNGKLLPIQIYITIKNNRVDTKDYISNDEANGNPRWGKSLLLYLS
jgi:hypothetical protein